MTRLDRGESLTPPSLDSFVSILFVEPRIYAQLDLLHACQDAGAQLALSCVATCGGARDALAGSRYDCLLLSTNLCYENDERREVAALVQVARSRGITVLAFGPGNLGVLGLPVQESFRFSDLSAVVGH